MSEPPAEGSLRARLEDALRFPSRAIAAGIDLQACPHGGHHDAQGPDCRFCDSEEECRWLGEQEALATLDRRSERELAESLEFCYATLDATVSRDGHRVRTCACDTCRWLRRAEALLREAHVRLESRPGG